MTALYSPCTCCPRCCGTLRGNGAAGICGEGAALRAAWAGLHFGEEPPLTGTGGSGTIFLTGCNLRCAQCQNYQISQRGMGAPVSQADFVRLCLTLQNAGAQNINLVTGSHAVPVLADYLAAAKSASLTIPVCWNSSAYETTEMLTLLAEVVDIWLPDLKTLNPSVSAAFFAAADYPETAKEAIRWCVARAPLQFDPVGNLLSGVVVRHLALPSRLEDTAAVLDWLKGRVDDRAIVSVMTQFTPIPALSQGASTAGGAVPLRAVSPEEYGDITDLLEAYDFAHLYYQELGAGKEWLPDFTRPEPFPSALTKPVWHWREGWAASPASG
ncbi:MAG: radical SAM protein [Spirochaetaceae bacterium]|jgi:putative pyruvate formate lyase activating enzyme|nr:radical SAM protein [Spirochaetaceae bacterium]